MAFPLTFRPRDLVTRAVGFAMLLIGALAIERLYRQVHAAPSHGTTAFELGLAAAGFLLPSIGSALLMLGGHIFDRVTVSSRWTPQPPRREIVDRPGRLA